MFKRRRSRSNDYFEDGYLPNPYELTLALRRPTPEALLELIWLRKYKSFTIACPQCFRKSKFVCRSSGKNTFRCSHSYCYHEINPLEETIFKGSHIPLLSWFKALDMLYGNRKVGVQEIADSLGISWPSAKRVKESLLKEMRW